MVNIKDNTDRTLDSSHDNTIKFFIGEGEERNDTDAAMPKKSASKVARYATKYIGSLVDSEHYQTLKKRSRQPDVSQLDHCQLELGKVLGTGGFSSVFEIKRSLAKEIPAEKYVVKSLKKEVLVRAPKFACCAAGLAKEGVILGTLNHPHIVQLRACSIGGVENFSNGRYDAYFLVLERLTETLGDKLGQWAKQMHSMRQKKLNRKLRMFRLTSGNKTNRQTSNKLLSSSLFLERVLVGLQLADAIAYLHKNNILHRDIKPGNIGFDCEGNVKLFDFDIARFVPKQNFDDNDDETFQMTMKIGTRRYMSPECALGQEYNLKSDVYGYAMVLHQILSLEIPFEHLSQHEHVDLVFQQGMRPLISNAWPEAIQQTLHQAWNGNHRIRPTMKEIHSVMKDEFELLNQLHSQDHQQGN